MVYHPFSIANCFSKSLKCLLVSALLIATVTNPALALVKMESKTVDAALVYGMRNQKLGLSSILGPNWVEGENGALLNVYSPFMILATKASKAGFSSNPSQSDLNKARKRFAKEVAYYSDTKNRLQVKFAVSLYGGSPSFAKTYTAKIVGFGRGKEFEIKPAKVNLANVANGITGGQAGATYEAVNGYYFNFADLENLEEFSLILESPTSPAVKFRMKNAKIY